jgi:hypothetical protein
MNRDSTEILASLKSKKSLKQHFQKQIKEMIAKRFDLKLPFGEHQNYGYEQLNNVFDCLIEMLAETLAEP